MTSARRAASLARRFQACWRRNSLFSAICLAAAFHLPLLASDSVLWDDATVAHAVESGQFQLMLDQFSDAGAPQWAWLHLALGTLPHGVRLYKLASLACLLGATGCIYSQARAGGATRFDSRLVSVAAAAYPFYSMWHGLITLPYAVCYLLFFVGLVLYQRHLLSGAQFSRGWLAAMAVLAFAFTIESLGVWFYGAAPFLGWLAATRAGKGGSPIDWGRLAWRHAPALALPPLVYFGKRLIYPMRGAYAGYNQVSFSASRLAEGFEDFLKRSFCDPLKDLAQFAWQSPWLFAGLAVVGLLLGVACAAGAPRRARRGGLERSPRLALLLAAWLYFCGALPYVAVGKAPVLNSYQSRHALLIAAPLAIGAAALLRGSFASGQQRRLRRRAAPQGGRRINWPAVATAILLAACFVLQTRSYIRWQNRYVKSLAIAENLRPFAAGADVVVLEDRAELGMPESWRIYEINAMLRRAFQDERRVGFAASQYSPEALAALHVDPVRKRYFGCRDCRTDSQAKVVRLTVRDNGANSEAEAYCGYLAASLGDFFTSDGGAAGASDKSRKRFARRLVRLECVPQPRVSGPAGPLRR